MLSWFVDSVGFFQVLLVIVALGFGTAAYLTNRARYLAIAAVCIAVVALLYSLPNLIVTDSKRLELNVREMANAVVNGNEAALRKHLADDFEYAGLKRDEVVQAIMHSARAHKVGHIKIWGWETEKMDRSAGLGQAWFGATVDDNQYTCRCRGYFKLVGEDWKLYKFEAFNPVVDQNNPIQIPIR